MAQKYRHFVVREEGGDFEFMSKRRWLRERRTVPIFGVRTPEGMIVFDRIILGFGHKSPLRFTGHMEWPPSAVPKKHANLGRGEGQAGWKDGRYTGRSDWSPGARYLRENFGLGG